MPKFLRTIKEKPIEPVRFDHISRTVYMSELHGKTLKQLFNKYPLEAIFHDDYDTGATLTFYSQETEDEFEARMEKYEEDLENYNKWYKQNKENLEYTIKITEEEKIRNKDLYIQNIKTKIRALEAELQNAESDKTKT